MVVEFVKQAQALEHEINLLQRDQRRVIPSKHLIVGDELVKVVEGMRSLRQVTNWLASHIAKRS